MSLGEYELQATGSMTERLDRLEDMLKAHHSFVNKKKRKAIRNSPKNKKLSKKVTI